MDDILLKRVDSKLDDKKIKVAFSHVYRELDEHLDTVNVNSSEIQSNYEYLCELDNKIAKLNERIDEIFNVLSNLTGKKLLKKPKFEDIDPLTTTEKNVFLNLYTEEKPLTYHQLAKKIKISIPLVREYVTNLLQKGIPIQKIYVNTIPHILLDPKFKNLQAKKNILKIEQKILG
ncbi:hypothetical protein KY331_02280 [Candidatus Woesearchaeota archaeon]|nr:hypothetical protein [Candidatus Woesearchaeota archaeon]